MKTLIISAQTDYVQGHLRYGHYELEVEEDVWNSMNEEEKKEYIEEHGDFLLDDYSIEGIGDINHIEVHN